MDLQRPLDEKGFEMTTKHPNAEWIKLFVDGVAIEWKSTVKEADDEWSQVYSLSCFDLWEYEFRRAPKRKKYRVAKIKPIV